LASKTDQIDENLKQALQKDLNTMAPGLTIQVSYFLKVIPCPSPNFFLEKFIIGI
jgi:hypothetical protein